MPDQKTEKLDANKPRSKAAYAGCVPPDTPADEYDASLLSPAKQAADGASVGDMTDYLVAIATEHMGLTQCDRGRAAQTAAEIKTYVNNLTKVC